MSTKSHTRVIHVATVDMSVRFLLLPFLLHLQTAGYEVHTACADGPWRREIEDIRIPVHRVKLTRRISPVQDLLALNQLRAIFRRERPTIVHTHTPKANLVGRLAARLARVPVVIGMEHGFYFYNMHGLSRSLHTQLSRVGALMSDATIVINSEDYNTALAESIILPPGLVYRPAGLGVDLQRFQPTTDGTVPRANLSIPQNASVVGFTGRLTPEKGCMEFLEAAARVRSQVANCHFLVIGPSEGGTQEELEARVAQLELGDCVHFLGTRTDMPQCYAAMDLFVLPSHREGIGLVLEEVAAMGKPAVTTNIRGCRDVVVDGETGLLVPPGDAESLALAMIQLLKDDESRKRMGQAARKRAEAMFDQEIAFREMKALYQRLLVAKGLA